VAEKLTAAQSLKVPPSESKLGERRNSWDEGGQGATADINNGRKSWGSNSAGGNYEAEVEQQMQHVRQILE